MSNPPWTRKAISRLFQPLFWLILILATIQAGSIGAIAQTTATNFAIGTTAQRSNLKHLGINLGGQDYWDSGQMLRNLTFANSGFEGETWNSVLNCNAATTTTCTDGNPWNVWPANFLNGATFQVLNGAAAGETGTITSYSPSDYEATGSNNPTYGGTLTFGALSTPLAAGDYILVSMTVPGNPTAGWWTNTSGGGSILADTTDLSPETPGKQAVELQATQSGQSANVTSYFDSTAGRSFLQLNGTYTVEFKAKSLGGNGQLNVSVARLGYASYLNQNVNLTSSWQDYSYTFTASEPGNAIGTVELNFSVAGADVLLDDADLTEAAAPNNPTAYRNAVVQRLRTLNPGVIRYMSGTDFGSSIANVVAVPYARQRAGIDTQQTVQPNVPMGLEEFLVLCQAVGAEPWYTMPGTMSTQDMQNLMDFLGGSTSTTYGAIRAAEGQSAPWTSVFPVIHLELGNEMWNNAMAGEAITNPVVYAQRASKIFAAAVASPSYNSSSFDLVMGSWANVPYWTQQELANASNYNSVDAAPYLYYTLSDYSSNEAIFGPMFAQPEQIDSTSNGYMYQQAQAAAAANPPANLNVYEVNLSTISGTAPQNVVTEVVGGVGAGITVADHMLLMMRDLGITTENMFALSEYENGFSNTATGAGEGTPLWGSVIDMGGETNLNRPQFLAEQLANSAILPTMLQVTVSGANPTWNQPQSANDTTQPIELANAHYLQSFAFTNGTQSSVVVFNLSRSGSLPVTFSGTNAPTGNVLVSQLTSANITDNNENNTPVVNTTQTNVSNFQPATPYSLPPFSMTVFSWPGTTLPASTTTLTASPTSGAPGQTVTLTATVTSHSGTTTPTGTVTFLNGSATLGTATLDSAGTATLTTTSLPAGSNSITASYGGDTNNGSSTSSPVIVTMTSNAVSTTTALSASASQINTGQSVTFTATVKPTTGTTVPTGTVSFLNGSTTLGTVTLNSSGVAAYSTSGLPAGTDSITASYGGNTSDTSSLSSPVTVTVSQTGAAATTTTLSGSASQIDAGQSVTFTATVKPTTGTTIPAGTVTFLNGSTTLGTATLNSKGVAAYSTSALPAGTDSITASYGGNTSDASSVSSAVTVTVTQTGAAATTTGLSASASQIDAGQSVTFTATVKPTTGTTTPTGTVTFVNGSTTLGTATLTSRGVASYSTSALPAGTDSVTASYGGSTSDASSVSSAVTVTVGQTEAAAAATTTGLSASASQIDAGQNVTFTATVKPMTGTTTPTGTVTFLNGSTTLGTATLSSKGVASYSTSALSAGTDSITASYGGSTSDSSSVSSAVTVAVAASGQTQGSSATTATTLTASSDQIDVGQSVTFAATVKRTSGNGTPKGTVTFLNGKTVLGEGTLNGGTASFATSSLAEGTYTITASYGGDSGDAASTSSALTETVAAAGSPSYTMAVSTSNVTVQQGQIANLTVTVTPVNGFNTPVSMSCSGMRAGTSCSFNPSTVTPDGKPVSSTLSINTSIPSETAQNRAPKGQSRGGFALGLVMPWGLLSLLGLRRRREKRGHLVVWSTRIAVTVALIAGSLWMSGCGYSVNQSAFTMTVTTSARNVPVQTSQVTVNISQ